MTMTSFTIGETDWARDAARLGAVRRAVFIDEQGVPEALEWDEYDAVSTHWLALAEDGSPIGCARLLPDGHIGRMAVLRECRSMGVGSRILERLIERARERGDREVVLSAQVHAMSFYARHGFTAVGPVYQEAGIPHQDMRRPL